MNNGKSALIVLLAGIVGLASVRGASYDPSTSLVGVSSGSLNAAKTQLTITSTDVPDNSTILYGPLTINFPANQNLNLAYPYRGGTDGATNSHTSLIHFPGVIGITVAGLVIYAPPNLSVITKNGVSWYYDANQAKINGEDIYGGHCSNVNGGQYHYHDIAFVTNNSWVGVTGFTGNSYRQADGHSKLLGWSADGYPIYGPYGYVKPTDSTSGTQLMVSGYTTTNTGANRPSSVTATVVGAVSNSTFVVFGSDPGALGLNPGMRITTNSAGLATKTYYILNQKNVTYTGGGHPPYTGATNSVQLNSAVTIANGASLTFEYLAGLFVEDSTFTNTGTLDVYNGRYCVTPEFPGGTYAYFMTQDSNGNGVYPYLIGQYYYGSTAVSSNYTWSGGSGTWTTGTGGWSAGAWADGNNVIVGSGSDTAGTITLSSTVNPAAISFSAPGSGKYTLAVNGSIATAGTIVTGSGVTIRGTGSIVRTMQTDSTSVVWPGAATKGSAVPSGGEALTVSALDMHNGGKLSIALNATSTTSTQKLIVSGSCTLGGTLSLGIPAGTSSGNAYTVLTSGNTLSGTFSSVSLNGSTVTGTSPINVQYNSNSVTVTITGSVTAATLNEFAAKASGAGVALSWEALSEFQNAGFDIWRRPVGTDNWIRVNPALIAGRVTNPDSKTYRYFDWADPGIYDYRLESIDINGTREVFRELAGPVHVDALELTSAEDETLEGVDAEAVLDASVAATQNSARVFAGMALTPAKAVDAAVQKREIQAGGTAVARWWASASDPGSAANTTVAKVIYAANGVMLIPADSLPTGFDANHLALQREGRNLDALAVTRAGVLVYGPGYQDDYTNRDAIFLRSIPGATRTGQATTASGLFADSAPAVTSSPATASASFHDVYFDYSQRPYTFPPWFSAKYLSQGTTQDFTLTVPQPQNEAATLTVNVWSLTHSDSVSPDHALYVSVNGQAIGRTQWTGGERMLQLSFSVPKGVLIDGANTVSLTTPALDGLETQIAFLHSLALDYTQKLDGSRPLQIATMGSAPQLYEIANVPAGGAWVVDAHFPDKPVLLATETMPQGNGALRLRFKAGSGPILITPVGQENRPESIHVRELKPPKRGGTYLATGPVQFAAGVQPLLAARAKEGIRGQFIDQEQLFDLYNFGRYGPAGIQNAVRAMRPKYLLLVGRTTYDYLNYEGQNVDPLCPAFLVSTNFWAQTTSDALFGDLGRGSPEVAVGRLPVNTPDELNVAVNRILSYTGAPVSGIRVHAAADQTDPQAGDFGALLDGIAQSNPELFWKRNYLGATYQTAPEVTAKLTQAANGSADWIVYEGHGNSVRLGANDPRILRTDAAGDTVKDWTGNTILLQSTCTAHWMAKNMSGFRSIAMQALTQPQGGISASVGTSTYIGADAGADFMKLLLANATAPGARWGDVVLRTQQQVCALSTSTSSGVKSVYADLWRTEALFGDPAMSVHSTGGSKNSRDVAPHERDAVALARSLGHTVLPEPAPLPPSVEAIQRMRMNDDRAKAPAVRSMLLASDENVRMAAMLTLSQWGDDASRAAFEAATQSETPAVQSAGREALNRLDSLERFVPYPQQTLENLARALKSPRPRVRHQAAAALLRYGSAARECVNELSAALAQSDGSCTLAELSPYLEVLRQIGADAAAAGPVLCDLLDERSPVNAGRDKHTVYALRNHLIVTLADIGQAQLGLRQIVDMLANSNQAVDFNFAVAAYAAGSLGPKGTELIPFLTRAWAPDFNDGVAPLGAHGERALPVLTSSGKVEALRALAKIGYDATELQKREAR